VHFCVIPSAVVWAHTVFLPGVEKCLFASRNPHNKDVHYRTVRPSLSFGVILLAVVIYRESCAVSQKCAANYTFYFVSGSRTLWIWDIHSRAVSAIHCSKLFNRQCTSQFFYLKYQKYHHQVAYYWASSFCCSLSVPTRFTVDVHYWSYQGHSRSSILVYQSTAHMRLPICQ